MLTASELAVRLRTSVAYIRPFEREELAGAHARADRCGLKLARGAADTSGVPSSVPEQYGVERHRPTGDATRSQRQTPAGGVDVSAGGIRVLLAPPASAVEALRRSSIAIRPSLALSSHEPMTTRPPDVFGQAAGAISRVA
jgi:hypothetical protein